MKKLKKISLSKKDVVKLEDYEMARVEGGGSTDLVSCYLCSELYNNCGSTTTSKQTSTTVLHVDGTANSCVSCPL
ncbi:MAG: hypothetical protein K0Q87_1085 [Neobacillus sp.]|jgi:natural product precursor|nr:hypothetical protein [Neobacillus sp.]